MNLDEFMTDGNYLPDFMRDFHDCKRVFKRIDEMVQARRESNIEANKTLPDMGLVNWVDAHIYVVDFFLWYMAKRGYTLQKCRKNVKGLLDLEQDLKDFDKREAESMAEFFKTEMGL